MSQKSKKALRTIGEVASEIGVEPHVLRFWEGKFKQIKPQKRRGRRYYRPEDVKLVNIIKSLLYTQGFTIKGAQRFLKQSSSKDEVLELTHELGATLEHGANRNMDAQSNAKAQHKEHQAEQPQKQVQPRQPPAKTGLKAASPITQLQPSLFTLPEASNEETPAQQQEVAQKEPQPQSRAETPSVPVPAKAGFSQAEKRKLGEIYRGLCYTKEKLDELVD